ncbi:MAG: hypothetical protein Q8N63_01900 [Nanoarchaeota archaeon]|nr:hypothetical protein [Nanoarchaeota archaeon]
MPREIECVGENLEDFIKYGDQVTGYRDFQGGPDPYVSKKAQNYFILGMKFGRDFDEGKDFLESLKAHSESCEKCSEIIQELKEKYKLIKEEELKKLSEQTKNNLRYFELI